MAEGIPADEGAQRQQQPFDQSAKIRIGIRLYVTGCSMVSLLFFAPFTEREGHAGFIWSELQKKGTRPEKLPDPFGKEADSSFKWFPDITWNAEEKENPAKQNPFMRIFGHTDFTKEGGENLQEDPEGWAVSYSEFFHPGEKWEAVVECKSAACLYLDGHAEEKLAPGIRTIQRNLTPGRHSLILSVKREKREWGALIKSSAALKAPGRISGYEAVYLGMLPEKDSFRDRLSFFKLHQTLQGKDVWRVDAPDCIVRPFLQSRFFGRWNYPLGVTLYGLHKTGELLGDEAILAYVEKHMGQCVDGFALAEFMCHNYGTAGLDEQMQNFNCLDFCGSFGSCMLEVFRGRQKEEADAIAEKIADFMCKRLERLPDGTFFRDDDGYPVKETLWADDMYMCIPFLCRYAQRSGKTEFLEEAVKQMLQYWEYLYMPEENLLSHVYDCVRKKQTRVPWGRGNGWYLFSLAELLTVLPDTHPQRPKLIRHFEELAEGFLKVQAPDGMWRQVLNREDSYEEASGTAMAVYAFARAVRLSIVSGEFKIRLVKALYNGVEALKAICLDEQGNLYGTAGGSYFSYDEEYYAKQLLWRKNDPHGTGIVLLALGEWILMTQE